MEKGKAGKLRASEKLHYDSEKEEERKKKLMEDFHTGDNKLWQCIECMRQPRDRGPRPCGGKCAITLDTWERRDQDAKEARARSKRRAR